MIVLYYLNLTNNHIYDIGKFIICKARGTRTGYGSSSATPKDCKFPFKHGNKIYKGCVPNSYGPWCATEVSSTGVLKKYARCNEYCKKDEGNVQKNCLFFDKQRASTKYFFNEFS